MTKEKSETAKAGEIVDLERNDCVTVATATTTIEDRYNFSKRRGRLFRPIRGNFQLAVVSRGPVRKYLVARA